MPSLADIPSAFMSSDAKLQLIEWIRILPIKNDLKDDLFTQWRDQFNVRATAEDYNRLHL